MAKDTNKDNVNVEEEKQEQEQVDTDITVLEEKIETLEKEFEDLNTQHLRLQADFINYRNRMKKEKESSITYGTELIACDLLPIIDNFNRALESEKDAKGNNLYEGIEMIHKQFTDVLEKHSVVEIEALGKEFDPNFHHAVVMEESDEHDSNIVIEVLQSGYMLKDKVIRPSMVKVSK